VRRRILPSEVNSFARARAAADEGDLGPLFSGSSATGESSPAAEERALGTLTHRLIELGIRRYRDGVYREPDPEWVTGLLKGADQEEVEAALAQARGMAERFFDSELWRTLGQAQRIETELSVLARYDHPVHGELLLQGQFDLYAEIGKRCEVVDFKTDRELNPEEYRYQLSLYREAAEALSGLPSRTTIFGLRDGRARELPPVPREEMDELLAAYVLG
jgi:hypothetical protein